MGRFFRSPYLTSKIDVKVHAMRLLLLCPYPVLPATAGGKIRIVKLARELSKHGVDVTILTPYHPCQSNELIEQEPFNIFQFPYPFLLPLLLNDKPFPYQYLTSFHPMLSSLIKHHFETADIIQFEHSQFARTSCHLPEGKAMIYDAHNVEYDYAKAECTLGWSSKLVGRRIAKLEQALISRSNHIFATTHDDCQRFMEIYNANTTKMSVVPNGIDEPTIIDTDDRCALEHFPELVHYRMRGMYSGSNVMHNRVAVNLLLSKIAPIRRDIAFVIHGKCGLSFQKSCKLRNVFFDPNENHFENYASANFFGINTVIDGGGSNLKVLQYLRYRMPVFSTAFGMRGYDNLLPYVRVCELEHLSEILDDVPRSPVPKGILAGYQWSSIATVMLKRYYDVLVP